MRRQLLLLALLCALCGAERAAAQYYTWGSDPPQKWSAIRTPDVRMIYPDTVAGIARRTLFYIRSVRPDIGYGFRHGPMRIPFVMHPENFQSNGLVMYLPKRVEFLTSPAVDSYSMPWYKQLVAHEYRHAVQYNNLDRGVIRALSYVLGQQGSTIGLLCMPIWAMEGDAVMSETMHSSFGRGLQPSFSMAYRAMGSVGRDRRNIDRWFCGSYRDYIPDHYELGYQICSYAWERYGENIWDKVAWYGSRNPYVLATTRVALGKFYKTNVIKLFRETFDELERYWDSLPETGDSAVPLTALPEKNHTTYQWMNLPRFRQLCQGNFLDIIFSCPYELHELTSNRFLSKLFFTLSDEQKEVLYYLFVKQYSTARLAAIRGQSDRNIRKLRMTIQKKLQKRMYEHLSEKLENDHGLTLREREFMEEYESLLQTTGKDAVIRRENKTKPRKKKAALDDAKDG